MYFLIGIWGGPKKEYAAIKFFLYTLVGSIGMLIAIVGLYQYTNKVPGMEGRSFDLVCLATNPEVKNKFDPNYDRAGNAAAGGGGFGKGGGGKEDGAGNRDERAR